MKKDNSTLILLVLAGFGIYWYWKNKKSPVVVEQTSAAATDTSLVETTMPEADYNVKFVINGMKKKLGNVPNTI
jgi:hypothetical protein